MKRVYKEGIQYRGIIYFFYEWNDSDKLQEDLRKGKYRDFCMSRPGEDEIFPVETKRGDFCLVYL